jgi:hypothetical protein
MKRMLIAAATVVLLRSGLESAHAFQATPSTEDCVGIAAYGEAIIEVQTQMAASIQEEGLNTAERDEFTISMPKWITMAETFEVAQIAMKEIEPPPGIAKWHQLQTEWLGYLSVWARTAARDGYPAARRLSERGTGDRLGEDSQRLRDQAIQARPSFDAILGRRASRYQEVLAGTPISTPEARREVE